MALPDGHVDQKEARLAQWNILILNPDNVVREGLELEKIRKINPQIKLLTWIPLGQEPGGMELAQRIPPEGADDWFCRQPNGKYIRPPWGGHFMNPYAAGFAWPRHVAEFVGKHYLGTGQYDGVLLDIMSEGPWMGADLNRDGLCDGRDQALWQQGAALAAAILRTNYPTGNGGTPWSARSPYFRDCNGNMHENAVGDEFGVPGWTNLWQGYRVCMSRAKPRPPIHFIAVDLRNGRSQEQAGEAQALLADDLRRMRLGLGTTLLDDGYFGFDRGDCLHGPLWWFSEYDADLGEPLGGYERQRYGRDTYSREFQNGTVIVNPADEALVVRTSEALLDATSGQAARTLTIPAQDARILVRRPDR